jgi:hypothetical protein
MGTTADDLKAAGLALAQSIVDGAEARAKTFLDDNSGSRAFVLERAKRYGDLAAEYLGASGDLDREHVQEQMDVVQQSIENEISAVAVNASVASRAEFKAILGAILDTAKAVLPIVVGLLKK